MVIDINIPKRCIDIWLGCGEAPPDAKAYCESYPGYAVAVLHSGSGDLRSLTAELLRENL